MLFALYPPRDIDDTSTQNHSRPGAALVLLCLIGITGCGGGGGGAGGGSSAAPPTALTLGTPTTVTGSAANELTFTFTESLTTIAGEPAVTFALHEANKGTAPVTVSAASDPVTKEVFPIMAVQALDPQGHPMNLPPITGSQSLTLAPGDTADISETFSMAYFPRRGRYTVTVASPGTEGVAALAGGLVLSAN